MTDPQTPAPVILVADDESHILHIVSLKLRNAGFEVLTAEDGEEALDIARRERPALLITDYQMPELTGLEVCQQLLEDEATAQIPAIMLTARGSGLTEEDLASTNIQGLITKPFSPREILTRVQQLTGQAAEVDA